MAERSADNITNIVRRLEGAISNLPTNPNEVDSTPCSVRPTAGRYDTIQLYLTTLATHNKSWFPGGAWVNTLE